MLAHRVAWALHHGVWPRHQIDHKDRQRKNNAIANLRDVTASLNNSNKKQRIGRSGVLGVYPHKSRWKAIACLDGQRFVFGTYDTIDEAKVSYEKNVAKALIDGKKLKGRGYNPVTRSVIQHRDLLASFHYDPQTGLLFRNLVDGTRSLHQSGSKEQGGYLRLMFNGWRVHLHAIVWFYVHGVWPTGIIDHIDGDKSNNRISNLRDVDPSVNALNRSFASERLRGIRQGRNKCGGWEAAITLGGVRHHIGTFSSLEQAQKAWNDFVDLRCPGAIMRLPKAEMFSEKMSHLPRLTTA